MHATLAAVLSCFLYFFLSPPLSPALLSVDRFRIPGRPPPPPPGTGVSRRLQVSQVPVGPACARLFIASGRPCGVGAPTRFPFPTPSEPVQSRAGTHVAPTNKPLPALPNRSSPLLPFPAVRRVGALQTHACIVPNIESRRSRDAVNLRDDRRPPVAAAQLLLPGEVRKSVQQCFARSFFFFMSRKWCVFSVVS